MNQQFYYFGTNTREAGHYMWEVGIESLHSSHLDIRRFGFNPETIASGEGHNRKEIPKGTVFLFHVNDYTILYIEGSCIDKRPGCKSVLWVKGNYTQAQMHTFALLLKPIKSIIDKMPFEVKW